MFALRLISLILLTWLSWLAGEVPNEKINDFGKMMVFLIFLTAPALYMLPTFEAWLKQHTNLASIALLNVFLGWTLIGWVIALTWAFKRSHATQISQDNNSINTKPSKTDKRACPECAEEILVAAKKCKHCGSDVTQGAQTLTNAANGNA